MKRVLLERLFATALILTPTSATSAEPASADRPILYGKPKFLAELESQKILESSGLAISRQRAGVIWTHNDSGDTPRIFAFDQRGRHWGEFAVFGAKAIDWEDMASFIYREKACILLGDVGDNPRRRKHGTLYLVAEPAHTDAVAHTIGSIRYTYEDGPRDCEAVAVDPTSNTLLLASKAIFECSVYRLKIPEPLDTELHTANRIARIPLPLVTSMDVSTDGRRAIVLTYGNAYEYRRRPAESWQTAFSRQPSTVLTPTRRQGESICYGHDGKTLYLTSEKAPTPLWQIPFVASP